MNENSELPSSDAIVATIFLSHVNARARGEPWKSAAEEYLGRTVWLLRRINKIRHAVVQQHAPPAKRLMAMNSRMMPLLERFADAFWQERGQDGRDPVLAIISPGTPSFFFEWEIGQPPDRLDVLLDVLVGEAAQGEHIEVTREVAREIRTLLPAYRALAEEVRQLSARLELLDKTADAIARAGHVQHARLRRRMRADGYNTAEVLRVFPDMPGGSITDTLSGTGNE